MNYIMHYDIYLCENNMCIRWKFFDMVYNAMRIVRHGTDRFPNWSSQLFCLISYYESNICIRRFSFPVTLSMQIFTPYIFDFQSFYVSCYYHCLCFTWIYMWVGIVVVLGDSFHHHRIQRFSGQYKGATLS